MNRSKIQRRRDGVLLLDKPLEWSSGYAARWVGALFGGKAGHAGTLDPAASGLLVVGVGEGTKILHYLSGADKRYHACVRVGMRTTTDDREGEIIETQPCPRLEVGQLREVLQSFTGVSEQVPPMYSALKQQGVPLYELARRNLTVVRPPRRITIRSIELTRVGVDSFCFAVTCSSGTYVRVLARQLGESLGSTGYLSALCRVSVGHFILADACTPAQVTGDCSVLLSTDAGLAHLPEIHLTRAQACRVRQGQFIDCRDDKVCNDGELPGQEEQRWRAYDDNGEFVGVLAHASSGGLKPERIFKRFTSA